MADPRVVQVMREYKQLLLAREALQMQQMARAWLDVERRLDDSLQALAAEVAALRAEGEVVTASTLYRLERYQRLAAQVQRELRRYADYAAQQIARGQADAGALGVEHAVGAIEASYQPYGLRVGFDRLPVEATEYMVGLAGDGSPLRDVLRQRVIAESGALDRATQTLVNATAQGWNPRKTARAMANDFTAGLDKALTVARTEEMRVYRQASVGQYAASGVVQGQKRLATHDSRVCLGCLAAEGKVYPIDAVIPDHPNGRCTGVPIVVGLPDVQYAAGEEWFAGLSPDEQQAILGPQRYELWSSGQVPFTSFSTQHENATWGPSVAPTPLGGL